MTDLPTDDPLILMAADSLRRSDAPRFLLSLFSLPPGEHRIAPPLPGVSTASEVWVFITETGGRRRARVSIPFHFEEENSAGLMMPTVWQHVLVDGTAVREAKTYEETLPETFDHEVELAQIAAGDLAIEDMCDACDLPRDPALRGQEAPPPLESNPSA
jgi:hypothetical protein